MSANPDEMKELIRRLNKEVFREGNLEAIDELYAEDYVEHNPAMPQEIRGPDEVREKVMMFDSAFSDASGSTEDIIVEGDKVADRHRFSATHSGEFMGIEPTGNEVDIEGIAIHRIKEGKIVEGWIQGDIMGMMEQLGVTESP